MIYIVMAIGVALVTGDSNFFMTMSGFGEGDPKAAMAAAGERLKNPLIMLLGVLSIVAYCFAYALWIVSIVGIPAHAVKAWGR